MKTKQGPRSFSACNIKHTAEISEHGKLNIYHTPKDRRADNEPLFIVGIETFGESEIFLTPESMANLFQAYGEFTTALQFGKFNENSRFPFVEAPRGKCMTLEGIVDRLRSEFGFRRIEFIFDFEEFKDAEGKSALHSYCELNMKKEDGEVKVYRGVDYDEVMTYLLRNYWHRKQEQVEESKDGNSECGHSGDSEKR